MNDSLLSFIAGMIIGTFTFGAIIMSHGAPFKLIVQHQCGHYDSKSGDFKWNTPLIQSDESQDE